MPEESRPAGWSPHLVCRGTRFARGGQFKFGAADCLSVRLFFFRWLLETATSVCRVLGIKRHFLFGGNEDSYNNSTKSLYWYGVCFFFSRK